MLIQVIVATKWEQIQQLSRIVFFFWKPAVIPYFNLFIYLKALRDWTFAYMSYLYCILLLLSQYQS